MIANFLRRLSYILGSILLLGSLTGCDDDKLDGSLSFSNDNLLLKAAGDTVVIDVEAGSVWSAESQAEWCTVEEVDGKLVVRVAPTDDVYERGTAVKVTCADNVVRLAIRQEPMMFEIVEGKKTLSFDKRIATDVLKIHTNMSWKVEIADTTGWLQVADTVGTGDTELVFTTSDNSQSKERKTTVRLRYGVRTLKLTATQNGGIRANGHIQKHYGERDLDKGYNLIFLGDGFIDKDLIAETGVFDKAVEEACEALFAVEPYKTYKEYFNVYSIACESKERGASTAGEGEIKNTVFYAEYDEENVSYDIIRSSAWTYAKQILGMTDDILKNNTCVVVLVNDERYGGNTDWYADGRTLCVVPLNRDTQLPGGFTNIFLHEVGGHGIGKLADEWSNPNAVLTAEGRTELFAMYQNKFLLNLSFPNSATMGKYVQYAWGIYNRPEYQDVLLLLQNGGDGGHGFVSGTAARTQVLHSEAYSCMLNHLPYFSVACRYGIVYNMLVKSLGVFTITDGASQTAFNNSFFEHDTFEVPAEQPVSDRPHLTRPLWIEAIE